MFDRSRDVNSGGARHDALPRAFEPDIADRNLSTVDVLELRHDTASSDVVAIEDPPRE